MISAFFKNEIAKFIDEKAIKADVTINGTTYVVPIRRSIVTDNVIRKQIYLTQNEPAGAVTRVRLLDKNGNVLDQRVDRQYHEKNKGLLLEFKYTVQEG